MDDDKLTIPEGMKQIHLILSKKSFMQDFDGLDEAEDFEDDEDSVNYWLERFYDYCDNKLIWVEL